MSKTNTPAKAKPGPAAPGDRVDPFAHKKDAHWGKGGSFVVDEKTGKREPAKPADKE